MLQSPRRIAVLGSTGSIGSQALDVIRQLPDRFQAIALAGGKNTGLLAKQVAEVRPRYVFAETASPALAAAADEAGSRFVSMDEMALADDVDIVLVGTAGRPG